MDAILSTATFAVIILLTALPFVWPHRRHRALPVGLLVGVVGYWFTVLVNSGVNFVVQMTFFQDVVLDLLPTWLIGGVVSALATIAFEVARYIPLFAYAHALRNDRTLIPSVAASVAVGFWGMMLLRVIWNNPSAAILSFDTGASFYLTTIFGVISFVALGLALQRGLKAGLVVTVLLVVLQLIRNNAQMYLPETTLMETVVLIVNVLISLGLFAVALILFHRQEKQLDTTASAANIPG